MLVTADDPAGSLISNIILITPCHGYIALWNLELLYMAFDYSEKTGAVILLISPPVKKATVFLLDFLHLKLWADYFPYFERRGRRVLVCVIRTDQTLCNALLWGGEIITVYKLLFLLHDTPQNVLYRPEIIKVWLTKNPSKVEPLNSHSMPVDAQYHVSNIGSKKTSRPKSWNSILLHACNWHTQSKSWS